MPNYKPLEVSVIGAGILGVTLGVGGFLYNLPKFIVYESLSNRLESFNSQMDIKRNPNQVSQYNKNVLEINSLSGKAEDSMIYGLVSLAVGAASSVFIRQGYETRKKRLKIERIKHSNIPLPPMKKPPQQGRYNQRIF